MKCTFLSIALLISLVTLGQENPVKWNISIKRTAEAHYIIRAEGQVSTGWHVYAEPDTALGLEPVTLHLENENIVREDEANNKIFDGHNLIHLDFKDPLFENKLVKVYGNEIQIEQPVIIKGNIPASFTIAIHGFASNNKEFLPFETTKEIFPEGGTASAGKIKLTTVDLDKPVSACGETQNTNKGLLAIFMLGVAGGLLALLTPCVFPMIPVTVSFFTGRAKTKNEGVKNGILYGVFIFLVYVTASIPFHFIANINPQIFNTISTNAWVNVFFFAVFVFFALSFFGLFEIRLPSAIATRADANSHAGSSSGIFFMALTLAIVSFSCTGPILGSLLVGSLSASGGAWQLTSGMAGFGCALALPFALFAMFPGWMKRLPKSGAWMDTVKKILAFAELALALKFLSNADLVMHWGLLKREVFIAIWIVITLALAIYLFGKLQDKFEGSPGLHSIKEMLGVVALIFTGYLCLGLTNTEYANLKLLSGFPPPLSYSLYKDNGLDQKSLVPDVINDYDKALALAVAQGKPLLIDFTGWACVNCRKMEEQVWTKREIQSLIKANFILLSLYVDDRKKIGQPFTYNGKEIRTLGDKWAGFEALTFGQASQPLYVLLSPDEKLLNNPVGYTPNVNKYSKWLQCGLDAYDNRKSSE